MGKENFIAHTGVDESGKGDYFGPLCVAGVQAAPHQIEQLIEMGVIDSKKLSDKAIRSISQKIMESSIPYSVIRLFPQRYNVLYKEIRNLNTLLASLHAKIIEDLFVKTGCENALIDEFAKEEKVQAFLEEKGLPIIVTQKTKAESDPVVAAASIIARAAFITGMDELETMYGVHLPKGASLAVIQSGINIAREKGFDFLINVGKEHFKTHLDIKKRCN